MTDLEQRCRDLIASDEAVVALCAKIDGYDLAARTAEYRKQNERREALYRTIDLDMGARNAAFIAGLGAA